MPVELLLEVTGNFDFASDVLGESLIQDLDKIVQYLWNNPEVSIEVQGHTDLVGTAEYNYKLSVSRARKVADYIISKNIPKNRVSYEGYGESKPKKVDKNSKLSMNRRVEIKVRSSTNL